MNESSEFWRREVLKDNFEKKVGRVINSLKKYIVPVIGIWASGFLGFILYDLGCDRIENNKMKEITKEIGISSRKELLEEALSIAKGEDDFSIEEQREFAKYMGFKDKGKSKLEEDKIKFAKYPGYKKETPQELGRYKLFTFKLGEPGYFRPPLKIKGYKRNEKGEIVEVSYQIGRKKLVSRLGEYIIKYQKEKQEEIKKKIFENVKTKAEQKKQTPQAEQAQQSPKIVEEKNE